MPTLTAIKVTIGTRPNGEADHPDFSLLPIVIASGQDWADYIDIPSQGAGWQYDKSSGHKDDTPASPSGQQFGMMLVTAQFATEAIAQFPAIISAMTPAEAESFYDVEHAGAMDEEIVDVEILQAIERKNNFTPKIPLTPAQNKALDPTDDQPGVRPNKDKTFTGFKAQRGITVV